MSCLQLNPESLLKQHIFRWTIKELISSVKELISNVQDQPRCCLLTPAKKKPCPATLLLKSNFMKTWSYGLLHVSLENYVAEPTKYYWCAELFFASVTSWLRIKTFFNLSFPKGNHSARGSLHTQQSVLCTSSAVWAPHKQQCDHFCKWL